MYFIGFQQPQLLGTSPGSMRSPEYYQSPWAIPKRLRSLFWYLWESSNFRPVNFRILLIIPSGSFVELDKLSRCCYSTVGPGDLHLREASVTCSRSSESFTGVFTKEAGRCPAREVMSPISYVSLRTSIEPWQGRQETSSSSVDGLLKADWPSRNVHPTVLKSRVLAGYPLSGLRTSLIFSEMGAVRSGGFSPPVLDVHAPSLLTRP